MLEFGIKFNSLGYKAAEIQLLCRYTPILANHLTGCHGNHAFSPLLQDPKLIKHWISSFRDVPLAEGMSGISGTF